VDHRDIARHHVATYAAGVEASRRRRFVEHRNHRPPNRRRQFTQAALLRRHDARDHVGAFGDLRIVGPGFAHDGAIGEADHQHPQRGGADIQRDAQILGLAPFHQRL
jgi:hypothetical protein